MINMSYKILTPNNSDGTFTFTKEDLEKLLNDVYNEGKKAGNIHYVPYPQTSNPSAPYNPPYNPLNPNPYITWLGPNDVPPNLSSINNDVKYSTGTTTSKG